MSYATGQITSEPDPYDVLLGVVEGMLTAHAAWSYVGEYTAGNVFRVWRNLGTVNAWGEDFYIAFRKVNATTMYTEAFEDFDEINELVYRPAVIPANTLTPHTDGSWGATGLALNNAIINSYLDVAMLTTDFNYWAIATNNGLFLNATSTAFPSYLGLFESMHPEHEHEFPLTAWEMANADIDGAGSVSRRPSVSTSMLDAFAIYSHYAGNITNWTPIEGSIPGTIPALYGDKAMGSRFAVRHTTVTGGAYRGWMYDTLIFPVDGGVAQGDTITVEGDVYVYFGGSLWVNTDAV